MENCRNEWTEEKDGMVEMNGQKEEMGMKNCRHGLRESGMDNSII